MRFPEVTGNRGHCMIPDFLMIFLKNMGNRGHRKGITGFRKSLGIANRLSERPSLFRTFMYKYMFMVVNSKHVQTSFCSHRTYSLVAVQLMFTRHRARDSKQSISL